MKLFLASEAKHQKVAELVQQAYETCPEKFGQWMWKNHVPFVAHKAEELATTYGANTDWAVAGAWLHDFGDAFVYRFDEKHEALSEDKAREVLTDAGYSLEESSEVIENIIAPHSCKEGFFPQTLEGKVLATADALAHLSTDFYVQFTWLHIPEGKTYEEFLIWVEEKLDRDFNSKIFFDEVKEQIRPRYEALREVFIG